MELRIELEGMNKTVTITRRAYDFNGDTWIERAAEIRVSCEQAISAFYATEQAAEVRRACEQALTGADPGATYA